MLLNNYSIVFASPSVFFPKQRACSQASTTRHILQLKNLNSLLILFISIISFALFEIVSCENYQYTLKLSQPLTNNKTKKRRIILLRAKKL